LEKLVKMRRVVFEAWTVEFVESFSTDDKKKERMGWGRGEEEIGVASPPSSSNFTKPFSDLPLDQSLDLLMRFRATITDVITLTRVVRRYPK